MQNKRQSENGVDAKDFNKTVHMLLELLGRDMESANPSRERDLLMAVREGLFRVEIAGQLFDIIKSFRNLLLKSYPECSRIEFTKDRHVQLALAISKLSIQAFSGKSQIFDILKVK